MEWPDGYIKFKSIFTSEYFRPTHDNAYLSADEKDQKKSIVQFRLEKARDGMWRIKSPATGKYWRARPENMPWVTPDGDPNTEDTLFRIECFGCGQTTTIRFRHHNLNRYVCVDISAYRLCVISENTDKDSKDVFVYSKF